VGQIGFPLSALVRCQTPLASLEAHPELTALLQPCGSAELLSPAVHQAPHSTYIMTTPFSVERIFVCHMPK